MRHTSRKTRLTAVGLSLALFLAACGSDDDDASDDTTTTTEADSGGSDGTPTDFSDNGGREEADGELVLGLVLPQSGDLAEYGPGMIAGAQMAVRDINEAGGVLGQDLRVVVKDDGGGSNDDLAITGVDELINNDDVDGIIGAAGTGTTNAIIARVVDQGRAQCSPSNTGVALSDVEDQGLYFRTPPLDNLQPRALAEAIGNDGYENVAIVAANNDYGTGLAADLEPALTEGGINVAANLTYEPEGTAFDAEVQQVMEASPDAVVLIGYSGDGGKVLAEMIRQGVGPADMPIYVTDGMQSNELYQNVDPNDPSSVAGIKGTAAAAAEGGTFEEDLAEFEPGLPQTAYAAQAYDCVMLFALAAQKADSDSSKAIATETVPVSRGEGDDATECSTWADCLAALEAGEDVNYEGASGSVDLNDQGELSSGSFDVFVYGEDGQFTNEERIDLE
jgi:branched-chain amino acid transport system substrate-binding protein